MVSVAVEAAEYVAGLVVALAEEELEVVATEAVASAECTSRMQLVQCSRRSGSCCDQQNYFEVDSPPRNVRHRPQPHQVRKHPNMYRDTRTVHRTQCKLALALTAESDDVP